MTSTSVLCGLCGQEQKTDVAVLCIGCATVLHGDLRAVRTLLGLLRDTAARLTRIDRGTPGSDDDVRRTLDKRFPLTAASSPSPVDLAATDTGRRLRAAVTDPECSGGWLAPVDDRPRPCRTCRPHIRPAEEAS